MCIRDSPEHGKEVELFCLRLRLAAGHRQVQALSLIHICSTRSGVEIVVGEHLAAAVVVDGIAPPLLVEQHICGVGLLLDRKSVV